MIKLNKLGLYAWFGGNVSIDSRFKAIKEVGFDCVSLYWGDDYLSLTGNKYETIKLVKEKYGLEVENLHTPYTNAYDLFSTDEDKANAVINLYLSCIDDASKYDVPVIVIHLTNDNCNPNNINLDGVKRIKTLVDYAKVKNVKLAFENLTYNGLAYLDLVLTTYQDDCVGFCYDLGHDHVFSKNEFEILKKYQNRLFAMHLHGNDGKWDYHQRIVDGNIDLVKFKEALQEIKPKCPLSLEVIQNLNFNSYAEFKEYVKLLKEDLLSLVK